MLDMIYFENLSINTLICMAFTCWKPIYSAEPLFILGFFFFFLVAMKEICIYAYLVTWLPVKS